MKLGLKAKIILPIILLNVIVFLSQVLVFQDSIRKTLQSEFESKGSAVASTLAGSVQDTLLNRDASTIQGFIDQYREVKGVEYIYIENEKKEIIAHTFHPSVPSQFLNRSQSNEELEGEMKTSLIDLDGYGVIDIRAPILAGLLGNVYLGMGVEKEESVVLWPLILKSLLFRGLLAFIGLSISAWILHRSIAPIIDLTRTVNSIIRDKNLGVTIYTRSDDEIGQLGRAFNSMLADLRKHTDGLEALVDERTQELESTRASLVHSSKMSALGEMAGGIAHEINNPLGIITGTVRRVRRSLAKDGVESQNVSGFLDKIDLTAHRLVRIVNGLRIFAREGSADPFVPHRVKDLLDDTLALCSERHRHRGISLEVSPFSEDLTVECRPVQLSQVLLNLVNNATDELTNLKSERKIKIGVETKGGRLELSVMDNGPGIPPEIREKIMQPFFTTKEIGKGTGLGLSISQGIVGEHGGKLILDPGSQQTRFVIDIPLTQSSPQDVRVA